jgi:dihydropyrimidinase
VSSLIIRGGRIVTESADFAGDILVEHGTISMIAGKIDDGADETIDATGKYVMPGAVDPHTHMEMPFNGTVTCDDFTSGTISAAFGGTTTIVDFAVQERGQPLPETIATWTEKMTRCPPVVDVGFHVAITDVNDEILADAALLPDAGITSIKLFMAYKGEIMVDDGAMFKVMQVAGKSGSLVMVHAENGDAIDVLRSEAVAAGHTTPAYHAVTRPPLTEAEATNRAIMLAQVAECPLYVVHVTCQPAIDPIVAARAKGWKVWGETCTHYLFIDESFLSRPNFEGAKYVYTPPPRAKHEQENVWRALTADDLSVVSSDHSTFNWATQKTMGKDDFRAIPNGAPGIEHRLQLLHHFGVREGRISLNRMVELVASNPARLFGLYPRKGTIAVGSDADLVVFDPERRVSLSSETHHSKIDYNLFEGMEVEGSPEVVLVRGKIVVAGDELVGEPGVGQFVRRA